MTRGSDSDRTVVVGVDPATAPAISQAVVESGARMARRFSARLHVLAAVEGLAGDEQSIFLLPSLKRWIEEELESTRGDVQKLLVASNLQGISEVGFSVVEGSAHTSIKETARDKDCCLVVIGAPHPTAGVGSTAGKVARTAGVPVLIVRTPPDAGYRNILVGVDFSDDAKVALETVCGLVDKGGRVTLCHVLNTLGKNGHGEIADARAAILEKLAQWGCDLDGDCSLSYELETGDPRKVLPGLTTSGNFDLLALGACGHSPVSHLLLGGVAEACARRGRCDLLVCGRAG